MGAKEATIELVENVVESTKNGFLEWSIKGKTSSSVKFEALGEDQSKFSIKVEYKFYGNRWVSDSLALSVTNGDFYLYAADREYPLVTELRNILMERYAPDFKPSDADVVEKINLISSKISKTGRRDFVLNKVLP